MTILPSSQARPTGPVLRGPPSSRWACARDATTLKDFGPLRRARPTRWHTVLRRRARRVGLSATVRETMQAGGQGLLLPESSTDREANRLKKVRHCARRLVEQYGDVRLSDINELWLKRKRRSGFWREACSKDIATACFTLLRQVVCRAAFVDKVKPTVAARLKPQRRAALGAVPTDREAASWGDVELLMARAELRVRAAVVLQAHIGASPGRVLALRVGDVLASDGVVRVWVPDSGDRLRPVFYALPADAVRALRPWLQRRAPLGPDALLFPTRGAPTRPTRSIGKALKREAERLGLSPVTMQEIQRLARVGLRDMGGTRAQVRGSKRVRPSERGASARRLARQRKGWAFQRGTGPGVVPVRAPRRCGADQPEKGRGRGRRVDGQWPVTPVVRGGVEPVAPEVWGSGTGPAAATVVGLPPVELVEPLLPDALPPAGAPAEGVEQAPRVVWGYTRADIMFAYQQGFSVGVGLSERLRSFGG